MAYREINRYLQVAGCTVYACDSNGLPESLPLAIDADVTLPAINHPTMDANIMGTQAVANQCALESMEVTINLPDSAAASRARKRGVRTFIIRHAVSISEAETGEIKLGGFTATVSGMISGKEGLSISPNGNVDTALTVQALKYRFIDDEGNEVVNVSRPDGILRINGEDYRAELRNLL